MISPNRAEITVVGRSRRAFLAVLAVERPVMRPNRRPAKRQLLRAGLLLTIAAGALDAQELAVSDGEFAADFLLSGEIIAEESIRFSVPNAGIWPVTVRWLAEDGAAVKKGETIVEFDNSQLASELIDLEQRVTDERLALAGLEAKSRSEEIQATLEVERKRATFAKAELDAGVPASLLPSQDHERRRLDLERARLDLEQSVKARELTLAASAAEVRKQALAVDRAEAELRRARDGIDRLSLATPRDGVILIGNDLREGRTYRSGDTTWPGLTIAELPDLETLAVEAWLFDVDADAVVAGMPVTATVDAFPQESLEGEVVAVQSFAEEVDRESTRRRFQVQVRLGGLDPERMRPGMSVKVVVHDRRSEVRLIPRAALAVDPRRPGGTVSARLYDGSRVPVELGPCNSNVCVLVDGPAAGTPLAAAGVAAIAGTAP